MRIVHDAFYQLQHDYSIGALFSLNMSALLAYHGGDVNLNVIIQVV